MGFILPHKTKAVDKMLRWLDSVTLRPTTTIENLACQFGLTLLSGVGYTYGGLVASSSIGEE